ncbi:MAG: DUF4271 domain-containing protein [Rikenellaceae bacterium]
MSVELQNIGDIPAYIFGAHSSLCDGGCDAASAAARSNSVWFAIAAFVLLVVYLVWLNHWSVRGGNHKSLFSFLGYHRGDYSKKMDAIHPSFNIYITTGFILSFVAMWLAVLSLMQLSKSSDYRLVVTILVAILGLYLYKIVLITLFGLVVGGYKSGGMVLRYINGICYTLTTIFVTPTILAYALSLGNIHNVILYIVGIQLFLIAVIYIYETFLFFISQKVSVLHTILYLCTVEIFPISLIWAFFYR